MEKTPRPKKKAQVMQSLCVSCGTCLKVCPTRAIGMFHGCYALIDAAKCVGCGKCAVACPAEVIKMREVRHEATA